MVIPSMTAISSLNDLYGCSFFLYLSFGQLPAMDTYPDSKTNCSLSRVAYLFSLAVTLSDISVHDSIMFMIMPIPGILSSQYVSQLCLDQSARKSCDPALYSILCDLCHRLATATNRLSLKLWGTHVSTILDMLMILCLLLSVQIIRENGLKK